MPARATPHTQPGSPRASDDDRSEAARADVAVGAVQQPVERCVNVRAGDTP